MKNPSVIITDPAKIRKFCLSQPSVSREEAINSILVQNGRPKISGAYLKQVAESDWFKRAHHNRSLGMGMPIEE